MAKKKRKKSTKNKNQKPAVKRAYKDSVFRALFNDEMALRELYGALSGHELSEKETIEIVTLEDAIHNGRKNDLAFTVGSKMVVLIEHQSTDSPNLPVRMFCYLAGVYDKMLDERVYSTTKITIPNPELYVFYNGKEDRDEEWEQRLSDLFVTMQKNLTVEVIVKVININYEKGAELLKKCETLNGYSLLLHKVQKCLAEYSEQDNALDQAMKLAIQECIDEGILVEFLRRKGGNVMSILRQVWTEQEMAEINQTIGREEGREEGRVEERKAIVSSMKAVGIAIDQIIAVTGCSQEEIEAL